MARSPTPVVLGEVEAPSGTLLLLDPGLSRFWRHDGDPRSPRAADPPAYDLQVVGPDALAAGRAFDRQWDPRYLFDVTDVAACTQHFATFVSSKGLQATAEVLSQRIPHLQRARLAVEAGEGAGVVTYNGLWAVAVGQLPRDRSFPIHGIPMPEGEFAGRWRSIDVVIDPRASVARSLTTQGVMVDHGQLLCSDLEAFGDFRMWQSQDGLADFVFWGADAEALAGQFAAPRLDDSLFGWTNVPEQDVGRLAQPVQDAVARQALKVGVDYRPHCNLEKLNSQVREGELRAGQLVLRGAKVCGFDNRWGDGIFEVIRDLDGSGRVVRVRLDVGNEGRQRLMRQVMLRAQGAIVSRKILDEGERIGFAERMQPSGPEDSGWVFTAGSESQRYMNNASHFAIVQVSGILDLEPALNVILDAGVGRVFRREGDQFIPEEE